MGFSGPLVSSGRSLQANQALQPLEAELNPPSQPVEGNDVSSREVLALERGRQDYPISGLKRLPGELMASLLGCLACLASRLRGRMRRLFDRDQAHSKRLRAGLALYPDRSIDHAACQGLAQLRDETDKVAVAIQPTRALAARADHEVRAGIDALWIRHTALFCLPSVPLWGPSWHQRCGSADRGLPSAHHSQLPDLSVAPANLRTDASDTTKPRWRCRQGPPTSPTPPSAADPACPDDTQVSAAANQPHW